MVGAAVDLCFLSPHVALNHAVHQDTAKVGDLYTRLLFLTPHIA